jgi:branched-chain amino acid transport system substrate-binding protein
VVKNSRTQGLCVFRKLTYTLLLLTFGTNAWSQTSTIKVAVQSPLSGEQSAIGETIKLGAQLAVEEAGKKYGTLGFRLVLVPYDDQAKPEVGVANARSIVSDSEILLLIGHLNSGVALPSSEVYKDFMLPMISPANTHPLITERGYPNVNRVCGRDDVQGPVAARFVGQDLRLKSVYIVHDKTLYGQGIADAFREESIRLTLKVSGYDGTEERINFSPVINPIKAKNPDLVYFGGPYQQAGLMLRQMRERKVNAAFMGPDGLDSSEMVKIAGQSVVGSYYTTVAGPIDAYPESAALARRFKQRFGKEVESFAMYSYDATNLGLTAIQQTINSLGGKKPTRSQVSTAIRQLTNFKGITGSIKLDSKGDPVKSRYLILKFESRNYPGKVVKLVEQELPSRRAK